MNTNRFCYDIVASRVNYLLLVACVKCLIVLHYTRPAENHVVLCTKSGSLNTNQFSCFTGLNSILLVLGECGSEHVLNRTHPSGELR